MEPITAVICTRNRAESLAATLRSVLAESPDELVLVDQSDDTATADLVQRLNDPRIKYIHSAIPGLSRAYNTAIRHAANERLAFTDDDCTVPTGWLANVGAAFDSNPGVSLIYGQVIAGTRDIPSRAYIPEFHIDRPRTMRPGGRFDVAGMGANYCARRQAMLAVGGFDEALGGGGKFSSSQDYDIQLRLWRAGHAILFSPEIVVLHFGMRTAEQWPATARAYGIGDGAFYLKHARCMDWIAIRLLGGILLKQAATPVVRAIRRRPYSAAYAKGFGTGLAKSFRHPVDRGTRRYTPNA